MIPKSLKRWRDYTSAARRAKKMSTGELTDWIDYTVTHIAIAFDNYRKNKNAFTSLELNNAVMIMAVMTDELARRTAAKLLARPVSLRLLPDKELSSLSWYHSERIK